jgi:hypothetical protein
LKRTIYSHVLKQTHHSDTFFKPVNPANYRAADSPGDKNAVSPSKIGIGGILGLRPAWTRIFTIVPGLLIAAMTGLPAYAPGPGYLLVIDKFSDKPLSSSSCQVMRILIR